MGATTEHRNAMFSLIENWQQSGLSQKNFCEQHQIAAHQFYYWYKCYRIKNDVPVVQVSKGFIELHSQGAGPEAAIEVLLSSGHRIYFNQPVAATFFKHLSAKAMLHLSPSTRYYLYTGHTDMRKGFDSLCGIVSSQMTLDALSGSVFIFINRKRSQVKLLLWEGDGLSVYYKRLEKGTYERPASDENGTSTVLSYQQLQFILQGVALQKISYRKRYQKIA